VVYSVEEYTRPRIVKFGWRNSLGDLFGRGIHKTSDSKGWLPEPSGDLQHSVFCLHPCSRCVEKAINGIALRLNFRRPLTYVRYASLKGR
jgi:hypothetical protein